jgi:hypothetical protein
MYRRLFFQELSKLYKNAGKLDKLSADIQSWEIPDRDKKLLLWHYVEGKPHKTVGVLIAKDEHLAAPLSERQVKRRHDKALDRVVEAIMSHFTKS